ncbi:hypothetical protein DPMN_034232 [Dreissena polymorpha]|uniref:Uncharacterized protein n=1 Tax=Dreissena polymorpha TaxID=45954 RepID=A0A9D4M772_DREPO|nr:hypothetical protein DPMN_034232 [Dreissena polymorpha]
MSALSRSVQRRYCRRLSLIITPLSPGADPGFLVRGGGILTDLLGVHGAASAPGGCRAKPC